MSALLDSLLTADDIETMCDDLRMGMQDLARNGPNVEDYARCVLTLGALKRAVESMNKAQAEA